jgi:hypothetical protein
VVVRIDATPPQVPARVRISESDIAWVVAFETLEPEISACTYKFGRPGDTRCSDPADYRPVLVPFVSLPKANRPYVFCTIPYDAALNPGSTFETILP